MIPVGEQDESKVVRKKKAGDEGKKKETGCDSLF